MERRREEGMDCRWQGRKETKKTTTTADLFSIELLPYMENSEVLEVLLVLFKLTCVIVFNLNMHI